MYKKAMSICLAISLSAVTTAFAAQDAGTPMPGTLSAAYPGKAYSPDAKGKVPAVGNTVDAANANWTNTIGAAELATVWTDPDFDPKLKAFYYARVLEIPTPRWSTYDAFRYAIDLPEGAPTSTQERAYTSPIWYTPVARK